MESSLAAGWLSSTWNRRAHRLAIMSPRRAAHLALGATRTQVISLVLRQTLLLTAVGILIGVAGAATLTRYLESMLFGLTPLDSTTWGGVSVLFAMVAAVAAYVPARRAMTIDPVRALRAE